MGSTKCWVSRSIAILGLVAGAGIASAAAGLLVESWWREKGGAGRLASVTQLETSGEAWLNGLLLAHGAVVTLLLACFTLLCLGLLTLEFCQLAVTPRLVLSRGALGDVTIRVDQVGKLAQREAEHVSGVREVKTSAQAGRAGIVVRQQIVVEPQFVFAMLAAQVQERVKQSLEHHLGLPVNRVQVMLQPTPMRKAVL